MWTAETGARLAQLRKHIRKVSTRELSDTTARNGRRIQCAQINRFELGRAVPGVNELFVLCTALDVDWKYFFPGDTYRLVSAKGRDVTQGTDVPRHSTGVYLHMTQIGAYRFTELTDQGELVQPLRQQVFLMAVNPIDVGSISRGLESFPGEATLFVQSGEVEALFARGESIEKTTLSTGDCVRFLTSTRHAFRATGGQMSAVCLLVLTD